MNTYVNTTYLWTVSWYDIAEARPSYMPCPSYESASKFAGQIVPGRATYASIVDATTGRVVEVVVPNATEPSV